jgi:predicted nucleic acid-binding protein
VIFYYLDASAWVKRYYRESGTSSVQRLFVTEQKLACASLGFVEVMATLARKRKAHDISSAAFEQKSVELESDWERFIQIQLSAEAVDLAKVMARRLGLRGADAIHLASALILQERFVDEDDRLVLVTSDRELKEAGETAGLIVLNPEEGESVL